MELQELASRHNPRIKRVLKIRERPEKYAPSHRAAAGEVVVEGPSNVLQALQSRHRVKYVLLTQELVEDERHVQLLTELLEKEVPLYVVDRMLMVKISGTETPQGMIGVVRVGTEKLSEQDVSDDALYVVSDRIQDPGNMGTLIRTADAAGVKTFISLKGSVNPFNPKSIRASAGSVFTVDIVFSDEDEFIPWAHERGVNIVITTGTAERTVYEYKPRGITALVFGNEGAGVSGVMLKASTDSVRVPIYGSAESLNVASAAAVIIYEMARRRKGTKEGD